MAQFLKTVFYLLFLLLSITLLSCQSKTEQQQNDTPKNIIMLVGDGMSFPQITATEYIHGQLNMTSMPVHGIVTTYASDNRVTDSASSATAFAAGYKTDNGMLGQLPDGTPVQSIASYASEIGKSTGLLATCRITHATPAAFAVHHHNRRDEFIIAEQFVDSGIDLILGAGWNYFLPESEGGERPDDRNLINEMQDLGYHYINDENNIGEITEHEKSIAFLEGQDLDVYPDRGDQAMQLTTAALERLSQNPEGFFIMIEGSQIDWAGHANEFEWMLQEMIDFDNIVGKVLEFAENDGNTLVVVTADHETGGLTLPGGGEDAEHGFRYEFSTGGHTALHVPVFSYGPSSEMFEGKYDNTDIARKLFSIWGHDIVDLE